MTVDIALVLGILVVSLILFISEIVRMDVVALLVLGSLFIAQQIDANQAFAGFSNSAVITVWAMFILSEGLTRTGIADIIGRQVMRIGGRKEVTLIFVIMITGAVLSAFMNNIGVAALMLPVVVEVARRTGVAASRLLMPLAYSTLLGGLMTLIGTPPNIPLGCSTSRHWAALSWSLVSFSSSSAGAFYYLTLVPKALNMSVSVVCARSTNCRNVHSWCTYRWTRCWSARRWRKLASVRQRA
jgi:di/tricarboxylate transporter